MSVRKNVFTASLCALGKVIHPADTMKTIANSIASATLAPSESDLIWERGALSETATIVQVPPATGFMEQGTSPKKRVLSH